MRFEETELADALLVHLEPHVDDRGFFARTFCEKEFANHGLPVRFPQANLSRNAHAMTLRGMHYAAQPFREAKLVRCTQGAIWDVIVDLRPDSPSRGRSFGVELNATSGLGLFVPEGFAHGFLTLSPDTDVTYLMGNFFEANAARGFRFDDPHFGIEWPEPPSVISERDRTYPNFCWESFDG